MAAIGGPEPSQERIRAGRGHNLGPPLESISWERHCWRIAHAKAWKSPPIEVVRMRLRRARELGMSYRDYTLEIMERGRYL